ncbi:SDR family oxidoreductase [Nakamurella lactea]|uniref:SDR family oxidoreductase n=1 Tax=Nakamurella lactea TaxID=459515 RepID=UPI000413BB6D|nr:NAD(P)H-binding protein [Nakamurella lactea]
MIVVTGATGILGRPLVAALKDQGVAVCAVSRSADAATMPVGVDVVAADLTRPEQLAPALEGADALFVHPRAVGESTAKLVALAAEKGVRRVVVLSAINVDDDLELQPSRLNGDRNKEVEDAVVGGGLPWVAVRAGSFATNAIGMFGAQVRAGDVVRAPYADFAEAPIHEADLAAVITRALLDESLDGRRIPVTGPQSVTHQEMVAIIGRVIGRPLRFEQVPPELAVRGMVANGLTAAFVRALMDRYERGAGRPAAVSDQVALILGRPALGFDRWVADHAGAFRATAG